VVARRTTAAGRIARKRRARRAKPLLLTREVLCELGGISLEQLMVWEHEEFFTPAQVVKAGGRVEPLYDPATLDRVRLIWRLAEELEVNLPGIGIILELLDRLAN
jgi:DNA-binding transcriptional MerR regulator